MKHFENIQSAELITPQNRKRGRPRSIAVGSLEKVSLQSAIYAQLKSAIISGRLVPGEPVSIRSLADLVGTSAIPVREALSRLSSEGAIEVLPNGSVGVPRMTRDRFLDIRGVRLILEGHAMEVAAQRISDAELELVEALFTDTVAAVDAGDIRGFHAVNQKMRFAIYHATRSPTLLPIIESLWLQVGPYFNIVFDGTAFLKQCLGYDRNAIDALHKRDGRSARLWIEHDMMVSGDRIIELLEDESMSVSV